MGHLEVPPHLAQERDLANQKKAIKLSMAADHTSEFMRLFLADVEYKDLTIDDLYVAGMKARSAAMVLMEMNGLVKDAKEELVAESKDRDAARKEQSK